MATAGPASVLIAFSVIGLVVYCVMCSLGEMATYIPLPDGLAGYGSRYVDPALGFTMGYSYLLKYFISTANQYVSGALAIQYWIAPETVNPGVWIAVYLILVVGINFAGVRYLGEVEFWLSSLKVCVIIGLIICMIIIMLGGGPNHDRLGFRFWKNPGAFATYKDIPDSKGKFVAFLSVLVNAVFAFLGTELVGVMVGEAQNPRRNIPRAIRLTFYRIVVFYVLSVFVLGCCVAYDDPQLNLTSKTTANASPFVIAIKNASIPVLPHIVNGSILLFTFSSSNSDLYVASRTLYGLSLRGEAPVCFSYTNKRGVPYYSLLLSAVFTMLAFMAVSTNSKLVFDYFVSYVSMFGLLIWISILVSHIYFIKACNKQGVDRNSFVYQAPFAPYSTYLALSICCLVALIKNFTVFIGSFDYKTFVAGYISIPFYFILLFGYKIVTNTKGIKSEEVDLFSYKDVIDKEEHEYLMKKEEDLKMFEHSKGVGWFYRKFIGWIF